MRALAALLAAVGALAAAEVLWGPAGLDPHVIWEVRLPRALGAAVAGMLLSLAGSLLQAAYRNPLADPYLLGISGLSTLTALGSYLLWRLAGMPYVGYFAGSLAGAAAGVALLLALARRMTLAGVLLAGVTMAFLTSAVQSLALLALPAEELGYIHLALQGSFAAYPWGHVGPAVTAAALGLYALAYGHSRWVAALAHGEEAAAGLGADVGRARTVALGVAAAAVALTVATVGPVGFLGLLGPHVGRWLARSWRLDLSLPYSAAFGAALALAADLAMRLLLPRDVPATPLLSVLGAAVVAWHLRRHAGLL